MKNTLFITFILLLFTGANSALGQSLDAPASSGTTPRDSLPESWQLDPAYLQTTPNCDKWWELFKDPCLERLISMAVQNNYDVSAAQHRIEAARQMSRADKAGYYPTLGVSAGWSQEQTSCDMQRAKGHAQTMSYFNLGLTMNWEIDVFGRIRAKLKGDKANLKVTEAEYDATLVSLCSNLAKAYFNLRMAQAQASLATAKGQRDFYSTQSAAMEKAYNEQAVSKMELLQSQTSLRTAEASIRNAQAAIESAQTMLAKCTVRAPISGYITDSEMSVGN